MTETTTSSGDEISTSEPPGGYCTLAENWWVFLLRGFLAFVIAALAFLMPAESLLAFTFVFGGFSFIDGVLGTVSAARNIKKGERWGWLALSGSLGILTGTVVVVFPFAATVVLALFLWSSIAVWSIFSGAFEIIAAIRLRKEMAGEIWLILSGLFSLVVGMVVVWMLLSRPLETFLALSWLLGFYAAIFGALMVMLGVTLRKARNGGTAEAPGRSSTGA